MVKRIDARGLSCPQPVLLATKAVDAGEFPFTIIVDNATAELNVSRTMRAKKLRVKAETRGDDIIIEVSK